MPFPPIAQCLHSLTWTFIFLQKLRTTSISFFVSKAKWLIATIGSSPNFLIFKICLSKLTKPFFKELVSSFLRFSFSTPPCIFNALIVATITTQLGFNPAFLHLISKNFSAPRSAPNPASVTT